MEFKSFYIKYDGHPGFNTKKVVEDEVTGILVNKIEMILFTNKGEVYGQPTLGADLYNYLHKTNVSAEFVKSEIEEQIKEFVPEITNTMYTLEVTIIPGTVEDMMLVDFVLNGVTVNAIFA